MAEIAQCLALLCPFFGRVVSLAENGGLTAAEVLSPNVFRSGPFPERDQRSLHSHQARRCGSHLWLRGALAPINR